MWQSRRLVAVVSNGGPWFAISTSLTLICLSASGMMFSKATVFLLPWRFWRLVARVGVMKEFVLPSCPVLTTSKGFAIVPGRLSGIAFIMNAGDVGLGYFPRSRRLVTMVTVMAVGAVGGTDCAVCVVAVSIVAKSGSAPDKKAIAMMSASANLSSSPGLVIH